ncbi:MAG: LGFP repeat-containing protein [Blastococcus sp.]
MSRRLRMVAVLGAALAALGVVVLPVTGRMPGNVAEAADTSQFRAGNIITDQLFFDGSAMSAGAVQTFLNVRNPNCVAGAMPCLKNYRQTTPTRAGSSICPGTYAGAANETAATIITKVGQACGVSQRVLLVILQKEEGLVTASGSSLSTTRYRSAMGFGCPDTAACDSTYYGFFNQVYAAASQYRRYAAYPDNYSHRAGMTNNVRYNPSSSCGSSPVYIANQATAGLYNYTPYQPNAAALAAGAGTGDYCSAYGNRNFWIYFTNWFGSTQTAGAGDLVDLYVATGAENGPLGAVTQGVTCGLLNSGCKQGYANGWIYWSPATGARVVRGGIGGSWIAGGAERGSLGYPLTSEAHTADSKGFVQRFEHGSIYWTTLGAMVVRGGIGGLWTASGAETGPLGYPVTSEAHTADSKGFVQKFEHGSIYWTSATGARALSGPIETAWKASGAETGSLGYPTTSVSTAADGKGQYARFQNGSVYWSSATGAWAVRGGIGGVWTADGAERGALGYPLTSEALTADSKGFVQKFEHGSIYWTSATGAQALSGPIETAWKASGAETGSLGYPTTSVSTGADGKGQYARFQNGSVYWSPATGVHTMTGAIGALYESAGAEHSWLGYPTSDVVTATDGTGQYAQYQGGTIYWSPSTGLHSLYGSVLSLYTAVGAEQSFLGYPAQSLLPTSDGVGRYAKFQGGSMYWSPTTNARILNGDILSLYASAGAEKSFLGYPTQSVGPTSDGVGRYAKFQGGGMYWSPTTNTRILSGDILSLYTAVGAEKSFLGYPTQSVGPTSDGVGRYAKFQGGSIYWSPTTGAHVVRGAFLTAWAATGYQQGYLGYPIKDAYAVSGGSRVDFQHGSITVATSTGKATVSRR